MLARPHDRSNAASSRVGSRRCFPTAALIPAIMLSAHFTLLYASARQKNVTADEPMHLLAGYSSLALRDFGFSVAHHHPALGTMINAVPLLFVEDLTLPPPASRGGHPMPWDSRFIFQQPSVSGDQLLRWCRIPTMLLSVLLGWAVYAFARCLYGFGPACLALGLYCASPNILAHGRLITTDLIAAFFVLTTTWALWRYLHRHTLRWFCASSLLLGGALAAKLSCILLVPVFIGALVWEAHRQTGPVRSGLRGTLRAARRAAPRICLAGLIAFATIWAIYGFEFRPRIETYADPISVKDAADPPSETHAVQDWFARWPVPATSYLECWLRMLGKQDAGHPAFLHGSVSSRGWPEYYVVAALIKTPLALFGLLALAAFAGRCFASDDSCRRVILWLTPLLWLLASTLSSQAIGLRHILPVYPFLHILAAGSARLWRPLWARAWIVAMIVWYGSCVAGIYPHYLAYFNESMGGPKHGYRWLVDSNLDWGQDLKLLSRYLRDRKIESIPLAYFGNARPETYGIRYTPMPVALGAARTPDDLTFRRPTHGLVAISATELQDVYAENKRRYAWLRKRVPVDFVGYSILIFDLGPSDPSGPSTGTESMPLHGG